MAEEDQKKFKRKYGQIKLGNPDHKSYKQLYTIKNVKNIYDSRQTLLIYLIVTQKLDLNLFTNQNKMRLRGKDLKY